MRSLGRRPVALLIPAMLAAAAVVQSATVDHADAGQITVTVPGCIVGANDLIGWWRGDGDMNAAVGPKMSGTAEFGRGLIGGAFNFDGTEGASAERMPSVSTGVTVDAWVRPAVTGRVEALVSRWDFASTNDAAHSYALLLLPGGTLLWLTDDTSTRRPLMLSARSETLLDGHYHHVAASWDDESTGLYVDGEPVASSPSQGGELNPALDTPVRIGSITGRGDTFSFVGFIDEPAIARRALEPAEIAALVAAGPHGKCATERGPGDGLGEVTSDEVHRWTPRRQW